MYERFEELLRKHGVKASDVAKAIGIRPSVLTDWKAGRYTPKHDKIILIANYFGVPVQWLETGEISEQTYYFNDDARDLAQFLFENPEYKILFDASRKVKKEDLELVKALVDRFSGDL